jgi:hypothetical protein
MLDNTELAALQRGSGNSGGEASTSSISPSVLNPPPPIAEDHDPFRDVREFSLLPVDRGKDAWLFLAASFVMEALIWGMCTSFF